MALLPSDRNNNNNNNNISSNTTTTSILVGATCGVIGVVVGLAIPFLLQRLITLGVTIQSKNDTTTITSSEGRCKSTTDGGGGGGGGDNGTHSVRSGLKNDSIRINQSKLNSFLSNILIKAATTSTSTSTILFNDTATSEKEAL